MALELQLDASAIGGLSDGDPVSTWADQSGNGRDVSQAEEAKQPLYKTGITPNGNPVVRFDGNADSLQATGFELAQPNTVIVVGSWGDGAEDEAWSDGASSSKRHLFAGYSGTGLLGNAGSNFSGGSTDTDLRVRAAVFNGASSLLRQGGATVKEGNSGTQALSGLTVGARYNQTGRFLDGDIAELRVYSGALSIEEIEAIEAELTAKWFKSAPDVTTSPATDISLTSATLNGSVNPNGLPTDYWLEYGEQLCSNPSAANGTTGWTNAGLTTFERVILGGESTPSAIAGIGTAFHGIGNGIIDRGWFDISVESGQTYRFSAWVYLKESSTQSVALTAGPTTNLFKFVSKQLTDEEDWHRLDLTFTADETTSYRISVAQGNAVEGGTATDFYWTGAVAMPVSYLPAGKDGDAGEGSEAVAVDELVQDLQSGTTYHFRLVAVNSEGEGQGEDEEFKTASLPTRRKPPLGLDTEVETPEGNHFRFPSGAKRASDRITQQNFSTQRGDGFHAGGANLAREIFRDYSDVTPMDIWRFVGHNGEVAYESRLLSDPRTNSPRPQIDINLVGWMTYLKSKKVGFLGVDKRMDGWGEPSVQRRADLILAGFDRSVAISAGFQDKGAAVSGVTMDFTNVISTAARTDLGEAWFYASGEEIGKLRFSRTRLTGAKGTYPEWVAYAHLSSDDLSTAYNSTENYSANDAVNQTLQATGDRRYAILQALRSESGGGGAHLTDLDNWESPAVIGTHGLTERGTWPDIGFYISDIMQYILQTYYPKVQWAGEDNSYVVQQCAYQDNRKFGYDIFQELNDLALWETNMWEDRKFYFEPADLTQYDWVIDPDDAGVEVVFDGDSIEDFANGIEVTYTGYDGIRHVLLPSDHVELRDEGEDNPANRWNEDLWTDVEVPWPCFESEALQFGRTALAEHNRPKRPARIRIYGHVQDGAGNWQQGWKVRNSQTAGIYKHPYDRPRLITHTHWDQESNLLELTLDVPPKTLDAIVARQMRSREAANL